MKNKKRAILISLTIILAVMAVVLVYCQYKYRQDNRVGIGIQVIYNEDGESYVDDFIYSYSPDTISEKTKQNLSKFITDSKTFHEDFEATYGPPYQVRATIETPKGKTVVRYQGTASNKTTGETENIDTTFTYDFILILYPEDLQRTSSVS